MKDIKILITGSNGLLGQHLIRSFQQQGIHFVATAHSVNRLSFCSEKYFRKLDVTKKNEVRKVIQEEAPTHIIHAAAMTNVDKCEEEIEQCYAVNRDSVRNILEGIGTKKIHLIYISTDFIFDGRKKIYDEQDIPHPLGEYGKSKWEGELVLARYKAVPTTILRTSLLYGVGEHLNKGNIFSWAMKELKQKKTLTIVNDQFRTPTFVEDLVQACNQSIQIGTTGVFNVSGGELHSMYEFIQKVAEFVGVSKNFVQEITSKELNQKANRPPSSGLNITKAKTVLGYQPTPFTETLKKLL